MESTWLCWENVPPFPTLFLSVAGAILSSVKKNLSMLQDRTKAPPLFFPLQWGNVCIGTECQRGRQAVETAAGEHDSALFYLDVFFSSLPSFVLFSSLLHSLPVLSDVLGTPPLPPLLFTSRSLSPPAGPFISPQPLMGKEKKKQLLIFDFSYVCLSQERKRNCVCSAREWQSLL